MSNEIDDKIQEHIFSCYDELFAFELFIDKENYLEDTGNSFICKKCKEVILNYE